MHNQLYHKAHYLWPYFTMFALNSIKAAKYQTI